MADSWTDDKAPYLGNAQSPRMERPDSAVGFRVGRAVLLQKVFREAARPAGGPEREPSERQGQTAQRTAQGRRQF